jgi:predicted phosphoribosyltransferase
MLTRFRDRREAGRHLADALRESVQGEDLQVLALPRGGVPVGYEVAVALGAPLDVFLVRKLGLPGQEELAMGAIAEGGVRVLNQEVVQMLRIPQRTIEEVAAAERAELARRERLYRGDHPPPDFRNRTVLLVDDGLATGSTMAAAVAGVRAQHPRRIIVAVPVASPQALAALQRVADDCVAVLVPHGFGGVGQWYEDFRQTTDAEVLSLLSALRPHAPAPGTA